MPPIFNLNADLLYFELRNVDKVRGAASVGGTPL